MKLNITTKESMILNEIADIQILSYKSILEGTLLKRSILLNSIEGALEDAIREAKWRISQYREIKETPNYIGILEESELSTMRHILFNMGDYFMFKYGIEHVNNLWHNFFEIDIFRNNTILKQKTV